MRRARILLGLGCGALLLMAGSAGGDAVAPRPALYPAALRPALSPSLSNTPRSLRGEGRPPLSNPARVLGGESPPPLHDPAPVLGGEVPHLLPGHSSPAPAPARARAPALPPVRPGVEVLLTDSLHVVRGLRVGLITNHTGVDSEGRSTADLLHAHPGVRLVALFAPEHGIRGTAEGGRAVAGGRDARTGLPVHSLYGRTRRPTAAMLQGLDALLFDIQDIGARPYTYVWTMAFALEAAAEHGLRFVVLDRPNPITGAAEGPLMRPEVRDSAQRLTGAYPVPLRHGMTAGEVARYVNGEFGIGAELAVVPADGWTHDRWLDGTGLPWIDPSPNIRSLDAALLYSGLVLLEGVDVSVGRGTEAPFSYVGAPWLDAAALIERLRGHRLPGVSFEPARVVPRGAGWVPFRGRTVHAVRLRVTDRESVRPVLTALVLLAEIHRQHPLDLSGGGLLQMLGSHWARDALARGGDPHAIWARWEAELRAWRPIRERYRIYPLTGEAGAHE